MKRMIIREEIQRINPRLFNVGDMVGMKFQYFIQTNQDMGIRELRAIIVEKDNSGGWKILTTFDTHGPVGKYRNYSLNWLINRFRSDSLWRVT